MLGIEPGEYARVQQVDSRENRVTIERENGARQTYDPRRLAGVAVYHENERAFSEGDRVQFTAPSRDLQVANRELGSIEKVNDAGNIQIRMDSGREVAFNIREHPHLDHGYAVTSHSSQGQTAERVLINVDTEKGEQLVNSRMAYVSVSRGQYDAQIYTDNRSELAHDLSRDVAAYRNWAGDRACGAEDRAGGDSGTQAAGANPQHRSRDGDVTLNAQPDGAGVSAARQSRADNNLDPVSQPR